MAVNVPLVHISELTEQTTAANTDNLIIGGTDAKRITLANIAKSILSVFSITSAEVSRLTGVKSNVQDQLDNKVVVMTGTTKSTRDILVVAETLSFSGGTATYNASRYFGQLTSVFAQIASANTAYTIVGSSASGTTVTVQARNVASGAAADGVSINIRMIIFGT